MTPTIATFRPWHRRFVDHVVDRLLRQRRPAGDLRELDARALVDIGIDASEIASIDAEATDPLVGVTRRRIAFA